MRTLLTVILCSCLYLSGKSQTITIPVSHFFTGTYGPGSHISVPVKLNGCFNIDNTFDLLLSDNTGNFPANPLKIGGHSQFFTPYVNGRIPATAIPGIYRLKVRSTSPVTEVITPLFTIGVQPGSTFAVNVASPQIIADSIFGTCSDVGNFTQQMVLANGTTVENSSLVLDSLFTTNSYSSSGSQISFTAVYGNYYTVQVRTKNANDVWSIRTYLVLASTRNLSLQTAGTNEVCYPDFKSYTVNISANGGIANNYPGTIYTISWGDNASEVYTHCQLIARNGALSHQYLNNSCGLSIVAGNTTIYNAYQVNIEAENVCPEGSFTPITTYAKVWSQPEADFINPLFACINVPVTFINTSSGNSAPGNAANCTANGTFEWYVDGVLVSITNDISQPFIYTFTSIGYHTVRLVMKTSPCSDDITQTICIEPVPVANFKMNGLDSVSGCPPQVVTLSNLSNVNPCRDMRFQWQVLDAAGNPAPAGAYSFITGNDTEPNPVIQFTVPGKYFIRLNVSNSCGAVSIQKPVLIRNIPHVVFPPDQSYCGTNRIIDFGTAFNHIPQYNEPHSPGDIYNWQVTGGTFSFVNGTTPGDRYPQILFSSYGTYTVTVTYTTGCGTETVSQQITFNESVGVDAGPPSATVCYTASDIQLNGSFTGPANSISWSTTGTGSFNPVDQVNTIYTFSLADKNNGQVKLILTAFASSPVCPVVTDTITIFIQPRIFANDNNRTICSNQAVNYTPNGNQPAATYTWTSAVVSGNVTGNTSGSGVINDVLSNTGTTDGVVVYYMVPHYNGCSGDTGRLTVTVRPLPTLTATPDRTDICSKDSVRIQLQSNITNVVFNWTAVAPATITGFTQGTYQPDAMIRNRLVNNGTTTDTVTYTITAYTVAGTGNYCAGETRIVKIAVVPGATQANAGTDQYLCNQTQATLAGNTINSGTATWFFVSGPNTPVITNPAQATTTVTNLVTGVYTFAYVVATPSGCPGSSDSVTIYNRPPVTQASAGNDTTICNYTNTPLTLSLHGNVAANPGESGQWTIIQNTTGFTPVIANPGQGATTISNVRPGIITLVWTITSDAGCPFTSDTISIRTYSVPVAGTLSPGTEVCKGSNVTLTLTNYNGQIIKWRIKRAPLNTNPFTDSAITTPTMQLLNLQDSVAVQAIVGSAGLSDGCSLYDTVTIIIPVSQPSIGGTTENDSTYCQGNATGVVTLSGHQGQILFWQSSTNNGANWGAIASTANPLPYNNLLQTTWYRAVVKNGACPADTSDITKITVLPGTGAANAGPDQQLCALDSTRLTGNIVPGVTYTWTQIAGPVLTLGNTSQNYLDITGLQLNQTYQFMYELSNGVCPPAKDTVTVYNSSPLINTINAFTDTICTGSSYTITAPPASGGNGTTPVYQWQVSLDGINFSNIAGAQQQNYSFIANSDAWLRRIATITPCTSASDTFFIKVQPGITNNIISSDAAVCINNPAPVITGSAPSGGNNVFTFQWQQSTDNGANWLDIIGANGQNYNPGILTQTTQFRRNVSTDLCSGSQAHISNVVTITVRPDAEALFSPADTIGCVPYVLTPAVINLQPYPDRNGNYLWYADDVFIGSGSTFPGYTITQADDTVVIKLKAISAYGCLDDSISHQFITQKIPQPSFTLSDTAGCGPLTVQIQNTTPDASSFSYEWDFGNGQTSTSVQPGAVVFQPNSAYGDTTYPIQLTVFSACDTITITQHVRIKSRPKALFAPNSTSGCSPFRVVFNNTSLGAFSYEWDFGDGTFFNTTSTDTFSHVYTTGIRDTFYVRLKANGECGFDTLRYAIVVSPNTIHLDFAINGDEESGCAPHTVRFINNSSGASSFHWDFGDGNVLNTTDNIDTVTHTYITPGIYTVYLHASNGCSDTVSTETVSVYQVPEAAFTINRFTACLGDTIRFTNQSSGATSYEWEFGDGNVSTLTNPTHIYSSPGNYRVLLRTFRANSPGIVCTDTISLPLVIVPSIQGWFDVSDSVSNCAPLTVTFTNRNTPSVSTQWDFGDGNTATGDVVTHTYPRTGTYTVTLTTTSPGGCTYVTTRTIRVLGPDGTFTYTTGFLCNDAPARFEATTVNTDSFFWEFGDGATLLTTDRIVYHTYANAGSYIPSVSFINTAGCRYVARGVDTIKVDKIRAGFTTTSQRFCGYTTVNFTDTSHAFFGKAGVRWDFGDGTTGTGGTVTHQYIISGTYHIQQIVTGNSGCSDTADRDIVINVNAIPVASIQAAATGCTNTNIPFTAVIQSPDSVNLINWTVSNGASGSNNPFIMNFTQPNLYIVQLIIGTVNGCYDTTTHQIRINPSPIVTSTNSLNLCRGNTVQLNAGGAPSYSWSPLQGLSCTNCPNPVASPLQTTAYVVQGTNQFGCSGYDTTVITVIQPFNITISPGDTICVNNESTRLLASGATSYQWSPAAGLSATDIPNPVASPAATTRYRVVGYDGFNCFTDTAFVLVAVGAYPVVNLGPDQTLPSGTLFQFNPQVVNGPIQQWLWTPATNLSCITCPAPVATIRNDITYVVRVTNTFGCSDQDSINIKVFCQNSQVFIPNAFTPDHDGINDILTVRGTGIAMVKSFRIFSRWGELVFERSNFAPNDPSNGWDGKVKGKEGESAVFVYTAEVICDNGTPYTFKGNVSLIK
jgi:large repetitive protein